MYGKAKQSNKPTAKTVLSITIQKFGELLESIRRKGLKAPKLNALIGTALGLLAGSFTSPRFGLQNSDNQAEQED
jgi:hypothetical protein